MSGAHYVGVEYLAHGRPAKAGIEVHGDCIVLVVDEAEVAHIYHDGRMIVHRTTGELVVARGNDAA